MICYRTDGRFFNLWWLKANTKVQEALVRDFLFADDCALAAHSKEDLQCLADCFSTAVKAFGLTISIKKTEVPGTTQPEPSIKINRAALKNVEDIPWQLPVFIRWPRHQNLLSTVQGQQRIWVPVNTSLVWAWYHAMKIAVYRAVVLPILLCGCETWTCYRRHLKKLDQFHLHCLRRLLGISWEDSHKPGGTSPFQHARCWGLDHDGPTQSQMDWPCDENGGQPSSKTDLLFWTGSQHSQAGWPDKALQRLPQELSVRLWQPSCCRSLPGVWTHRSVHQSLVCGHTKGTTKAVVTSWQDNYDDDRVCMHCFQ